MSVPNFTVMSVVEVQDNSDLLDAVPLTGITNLASDYGFYVPSGAEPQIPTLPSNFDPDSYALAFWFIPDFDFNDGQGRVLADIRNAGGERVGVVEKYPGGGVIGRFYDDSGSSFVDTSIIDCSSFVAGTGYFFGLRLDSGTLTLYAGGSSSSVGSVPTAEAGPYALRVGAVPAGTNAPGAYVVAVTDTGSNAAHVTDLYGSGSGLALSGPDSYLRRNGESLCVLWSGSASGAVDAVTIDGASNPLDTEDTGRIDLGGHYVNFGSGTDFHGSANASWWLEIEPDNVAGAWARDWSNWVESDNTRRVAWIGQNSADRLRVVLATGDAGGTAYADISFDLVNGTRYQFAITYDGSQTGDANRLKVFYRTRSASDGKYGAWTQDTLAFSGTIPATLNSPGGSAPPIRVGADGGGASFFDGKIDGVRWHSGATISNSARDAIVVNEPDPWVWEHSYRFEGDANDEIGSLDGTVIGSPSYVEDGRRDIGLFERFVKSGALYFDGVNDQVDLGNWQRFDGSTAFSMSFTFTPGKSGSFGTLFSRDDVSNYRQVLVDVASDMKMRCVLGTNLTGGVSIAETPALTVGQKYLAWVRYDGSGATDSDRLKISVSAYDPALGTYPVPTAQSLTFSASVPTSLITPPSSVTAYFGRHATGSYFKGVIDDIRMQHDTAYDTADLDAEKPYHASQFNRPWAHHWPFDGDAVDVVGAANGTITGAIDWYDGRQPEGWNLGVPGQHECWFERATGEATWGTWAVRVEGDGINDSRLFEDLTGSAALDTWYLVMADGRKLDSNTFGIGLEQSSGDAFSGYATELEDFVQSGSMARAGVSLRVNVDGGSADVRTFASSGSTHGYIDHVRVWTLPTVSITLANMPGGCLWSESKNGATYPWIGIFQKSDETILAQGVDDLQTAFGPIGGDSTVSTGWHTVALTFDGTTFTLLIDGTAESTTLVNSGDLDDLDQMTWGALRLLQSTNHFRGKLGRRIIADRAFSASDVQVAHRVFRRKYPALPAV